MAVQSVPNSRGRNVAISTDFLSVETRNFDVSAITAGGGVSVEMGEFLACAAPNGGAATRASAAGGAGTPAVSPALRCMFAERGRSDLQALRNEKVPVIYRGAFQAEFSLWYDENAGDIAAVQTNMAPGELLTVLEDADGRNVLGPLPGAGTYYIVGHSVAAPASVEDSVEAYIYDNPYQLTI